MPFKGEDYMCYGLHWYIMASWHWHYILQHILMPHMALCIWWCWCDHDHFDVLFCKICVGIKVTMIHNDDT
jgi:hypothetical protein